MSAGVPSSMAVKPNVQVIKIDGSSQLQLGSGMEATYSKVTETITGGGRTEYYYACKNDFVDGSNAYFTVNGTSIYDAFTFAWLRTISYPLSSVPLYYKTQLDFLTFPFPEPISNNWQNRLLTNKRVFSEGGSLVSEDSISYRIENLHALPAYKVLKFNDYEYAYARYYTIGGLVKVSKEVNRQNIAQGTVRTVKEYDYNSPFHKQVTETRTWNSSGNLFTDRFYYPTEYGNTFSSLKTQNILLPVDVRSYNGSKLISGTQIAYNQQGQAEIKYRFDSGVNDIAFNNQNPYTFTPYVWNTYDASGLWQTHLDNSGLSSVYLWGYKKQHPIAIIQNATYIQVRDALGGQPVVDRIANDSIFSASDSTLINNLRSNATFNNSLITTYTYKPLVGILSITDPRGVVIDYSYDNLGRLKDIIRAGRKEEAYEYRYKN
jgi:YD repeat-containing protein